MQNKSYTRTVVRVLVFLQILFGYSIFNISSAASSCGAPSYDRTTDEGIYVWQLCASNQWFMRAVGGGRASSNELRVEGRLMSDQSLAPITAVSLEPIDPNEQFPVPDFVNSSDPKDITFRFRVWRDAQDGMDFMVPNTASACLTITNPSNIPVFIGRTKEPVNPPFTLNTEVTDSSCGSNLPSIFMLLLSAN